MEVIFWHLFSIRHWQINMFSVLTLLWLFAKRKWVWLENVTIHTADQPTKKSHKTFTATRHLKDNKRKAISSHFLVKMIAKLERTQSNEYQYKDDHRTPINNGGYIKQYINNNRTTTLERSAAATGELYAFYSRKSTSPTEFKIQ